MIKPALQIETVAEGGVTVLRLVGCVTPDRQHAIDEHLRNLLTQGHRRIVVDLSAVEFVSSTGLGIFLFYRQSLEEKGGSLVLAAPSAAIWRMLSAAGLTRALEICTTVAEGVRRAGRKVGSGRLNAVS